MHRAPEYIASADLVKEYIENVRAIFTKYLKNLIV